MSSTGCGVWCRCSTSRAGCCTTLAGAARAVENSNFLRDCSSIMKIESTWSTRLTGECRYSAITDCPSRLREDSHEEVMAGPSVAGDVFDGTGAGRAERGCPRRTQSVAQWNRPGEGAVRCMPLLSRAALWGWDAQRRTLEPDAVGANLFRIQQHNFAQSAAAAHVRWFQQSLPE